MGEVARGHEQAAPEPDKSVLGRRYLDDESMLAALDRLAEHDGPITLVVGAGASMEAGLPSWGELIDRLLDDIAQERFSEVRSEWVEAMRDESVTAAAAVVRALSAGEAAFVDRVRAALYGGRPTTAHQPQALAQQVGWLKRLLGSELRIVTGNYDGLIESALAASGLDVHSYIQGREEPPGSAAVYHLHGRLIPSYPRTGRIVLTEADYAHVQQERSWQDGFMRQCFEESLCVFVGASLTDPNLIRWLYRYSLPEGLRHVAIFARQASPELRPAVRDAVEAATRARWGEVGVDSVFADFFGEIAQFLHEVGIRRANLSTDNFHDRARSRFMAAREILVPDAADHLRAAQDDASAYLRELLQGVRSIATAGELDLSAEVLGLAFWGVDHERGRVGLWATSDRSFREPTAIIYDRFEYRSKWVAVEAVTRGVPVQADPRVYASRWRFTRGIPVVVPGDGAAGRTISGVMTLTSMTPESESLLGRQGEVSMEVDRFLARAGAAIFE
jgi:NAD-dependent SIR2 family protein deacetylase